MAASTPPPLRSRHVRPADVLRSSFEQSLSFEELCTAGEAAGQLGPWRERHAQLSLTQTQRDTLAGFTRELNVLCLTGPWCGDCALQGAAVQRAAEASPEHIRLRFLPRSDEHAQLVVRSQINGGFRVPVTYLLAEDLAPVIAMGDRTLSRYRGMAAKTLPPDEAEALGVGPGFRDASFDPLAAVVQEVVEFLERGHLLLRLSGRLRQRSTGTDPAARAADGREQRRRAGLPRSPERLPRASRCAGPSVARC